MKDSGLPEAFDTVSVLGAGAWGTALAQVAAAAGRKVLIYAREPEVVQSINNDAENALFLPGIKLNASVRATADLADAAKSQLILAKEKLRKLLIAKGYI